MILSARIEQENRAALSFQIKREAVRIGFDACGIARAGLLETEARYLEQWLREGRHGKMKYMEENFDKRTDPRILVEGAKSVITVLKNYFPKSETNANTSDNPYKISKYAWGIDYHIVIKQKLNEIAEFIIGLVGERSHRCFVDSAPVMDKVWAKKAGLGWIGKNTNLITKKSGSFFFIGEIIIDLSLAYDGETKDYCGRCRKCIEACPTEALSEYQIDANKCISYLTIELKDSIPSEFHQQLDGWIFGCDVCQDVCPWNKFSLPHAEPHFDALTLIAQNEKKEWEALAKTTFKKIFRSSAISRVKYEKFLDNMKVNQRLPNNQV